MALLQIHITRRLLQLWSAWQCSVFVGPLCPAQRMVLLCMMGSYGYLLVMMAMPGLMICGQSHCWWVLTSNCFFPPFGQTEPNTVQAWLTAFHFVWGFCFGHGLLWWGGVCVLFCFAMKEVPNIVSPHMCRCIYPAVRWPSLPVTN